MATFSDDFNAFAWLDESSFEHPFLYSDLYFDSDESSISSTLHTPEGVHPSLPDVQLDTYSFHNSFGVSPQVLHEPFEKPVLLPALQLTDGNTDEDADGDNESEAADEDGSVYEESDDEDTYDDDYEEYVKAPRTKAPVSNLRSVPFPSLPSGSLKRRRSTHNDTVDTRPAKRAARTVPSSPTQSKPLTPVHAKSASPSPRSSRMRRVRNAPGPRNIQARLTYGISHDVLEALNFRCPVPACRYKSVGKRIPDFKRHLQTHQPDRTVVQCTGVRLSDADRFCIDDEYAAPYMVEDDDEELHVGGCMLTFSRSDALMRHVNNKNGKCVHYKQKVQRN